MRINVFLSEVEGENLKALLKRYGGKAPGYIRVLIADAYKYEFGGNRAKSPETVKVLDPEVVLTPEQKCEMIGGKVIKNNGIPSCERHIGKDGAMVQVFPLSLIERYMD